LTTEDRLTEKLNKEKEYLWTEMNALKEKLEKTNQQLELLEQSAPEHYSKALGARNKATEVKNKAEERLGEIDAIYKSVEDAHELVISLKDESDSNLATIKEYGSTAFDKSESIAQYHEQYLESKAEIDEALQELNRLVTEKDRLAVKVESLSEQVTNTELVAGKLKSLLSNATKQKSEFDTLHGEVFGFTYEDDNGEEVEQGGLKEELKDAYSKIKNDVASLNEEVSSVEQRYNEKLDSIEGQYQEGLESFK
jgi:chromosome segregation ATPase